MPHKPQKYLYDMLDSGRFLTHFCAGRSRADYHSDRGFRSAVEREYITIGEALFKLNQEHPTIAARISEYNRIISFRHVLVHGYDAIDDDIVWDTIEAKLPILLSDIEGLLDEMGNPPQEPESDSKAE